MYPDTKRGDGSPSDSIEMQPRGAAASKGGATVNSNSAGWTGHGEMYDQTRTRRLFNFSQLFAFSLTYMALWESICVNMYYALYNGGPQALFFSFIIVFCGVVAQAASLGEMASIQPVAGAQYHWTHHLAPPSIRRFATWIQGWVTWFGYVATLAAISNWTILQLEAIIKMNYPDYQVGGWHTSVLIIGMIVVEGSVNIYAFWIIPWIELLAGFLHVLLFVVFVVVLTVMGIRHDASFLLSTNYSWSGWTNEFVSWNLGMLTCTATFTAFDSALHMSEETKRAKMAVPRAMFWSIFMNGCLAFVMITIVLVSMSSVDDVLMEASPFVAIVLHTTGSVPATTAMTSGILVISLCSNLSSLSSVSRLTWAWARDKGLPRQLAYVSAKHRVPVRAVVLTGFLICALCLLNLNSSSYVAFGAIIAISSMGLYGSYAIAIACMLYARYAGNVRLGEWNCGRWGVYINSWALLYTCYAIFWLPWPTTLPVTAANMNYAGPIFGLVLIISISAWFVWARKSWPGPNQAIIDLVVES